jgi:thioredoxin-like negative regulator of GroEL
VTGLLALPLLLAAGGRETAPPPLAPAVTIRWERSFEEAQKKARRTGKPLFVDFWAEWCGWCERLDRTTYADPFVARAAHDFVAVKVDTEGSRKDRAVAARYDVTSLPTMVFLTPEGRQLWRVEAFQGPGQFPRTLAAALETGRTVIAWEEALGRNPDDPRALTALGLHLYDLGTRLAQQQCLDEARELFRRAIVHDAQEPLEERRRVRMLLAILANFGRDFAQAEKLVKEALTLGPKNEDEPKLLFVLGRTYLSAGRVNEGVQTFEIILRDYPQSAVAPKARETLVNVAQPRP